MKSDAAHRLLTAWRWRGRLRIVCLRITAAIPCSQRTILSCRAWRMNARRRRMRICPRLSMRRAWSFCMPFRTARPVKATACRWRSLPAARAHLAHLSGDLPRARMETHPALEKLRALDPKNMRARDALNALFELHALAMAHWNG